MFVFIKYAVTAGIVVLVSEVAKRSDKLGAVLAALPIVTTLTLIWLYLEKQPVAKIGNHAFYTFWYVLPTLPMFLLFPVTLPRIEFWLSLGATALVTAICFVATALIGKRFGITLF